MAPLETDERRAELEHEEESELAARTPRALTLQPKALEDLLARGDEGEGAHAWRRAERSPFELEISELSTAEGVNRPFDGREVREPRYQRTGGPRSSSRGVENPNDHVHDHHADPDRKRAVGGGGERSNRKPESRRTRRRERQRAHERRARQIQTEAPMQQRAKASREGRIQGQLGDEFGQHVPDDGGNQPLSGRNPTATTAWACTYSVAP